VISALPDSDARDSLDPGGSSTPSEAPAQ
ncbi:hypothetical protein JMJ77_0013249, partial [Colletotrichum scovillei]